MEMGRHVCAVRNCPNNSRNYRGSFFSFPRDFDRALEWVVSCTRHDLLSTVHYVHRTHRICAEHFQPQSFTNIMTKNRLNHHAIPTLFPFIRTKRENIVEIEHSYACGVLIAPQQLSRVDPLELPSTSTDTFNENVMEVDGCSIKEEELDTNFVKKEEMNFYCEEFDIKEESIDIKPEYDTEDKKDATTAISFQYIDFNVLQSDNELNDLPTDLAKKEEDANFSSEELSVKDEETDDISNQNTEIIHDDNKNLVVSDLSSGAIFLAKNKKLNGITLEEYKALAFEMFDGETAKSINELISSEKIKTTKNTKEIIIQCLKLYFANRIYYMYIDQKPFLPKLTVLSNYLRQHFLYRMNSLNSIIFEYFILKNNCFNEKSKYCILRIIKVDLRSSLFYNHSTDCIVGLAVDENLLMTKFELADVAYVLVLGGLYSNWQQPLGYYFFNSKKDRIKISQFLYNVVCGEANVIKNLCCLGVKVVALIVPHLVNMDLYRRLGLSESKPYFKVNGWPIYFLFDVENMLLNIRDAFIECSYIMCCSKWSKKNYVRKEYINLTYKLIKKNKSKILTRAHIKPRGLERKKVKLVLELFSDEVASFMNSCIREKKIPISAQETSEFIKHINLLILSLHDVRANNDQYQVLKNNYLRNVLGYLKSLVVNPTLKAPSMETGLMANINCLKITLKSIIDLAQHIREKEETFDYLDTSKFNLTFNGRFFKNLYKNCSNRKPSTLTPIKFHRAFKKLQTKSLLYSGISNCAAKYKEHLNQLNNYELLNSDIYEPNLLKENEIDTLINKVNYQTEKPMFEKNMVQYLLQTCSKFHSCDTCSEEIPAYYKTVIYKLEKYFQENFEYLMTKPNVFKSLINKCKFILKEPHSHHTDFFMMCLYFRIRIFFTLKSLNRGDLKRLPIYSVMALWQRSLI